MLLVVVNLLLVTRSCVIVVYVDGWLGILLRSFSLVNAWICVGSLFAAASFLRRATHALAWSCSCNQCIRAKLQRPRRRINSDCTDELAAKIATNGLVSQPVPSVSYCNYLSLIVICV